MIKLFVFLILLSSCAQATEPAAPPDFTTDSSQIPCHAILAVTSVHKDLTAAETLQTLGENVTIPCTHMLKIGDDVVTRVKLRRPDGTEHEEDLW